MSELRNCRKNIFGKLVSLLNRKNYIYIYIYLLTLGNFDTSYFPEINQLQKKSRCQVPKTPKFHSDFDVYMTHVKQMVHIRLQRSYQWLLNTFRTLALRDFSWRRRSRCLESAGSMMSACLVSAFVGMFSDSGASKTGTQEDGNY